MNKYTQKEMLADYITYKANNTENDNIIKKYSGYIDHENFAPKLQDEIFRRSLSDFKKEDSKFPYGLQPGDEVTPDALDRLYRQKLKEKGLTDQSHEIKKMFSDMRFNHDVGPDVLTCTHNYILLHLKSVKASRLERQPLCCLVNQGKWYKGLQAYPAEHGGLYIWDHTLDSLDFQSFNGKYWPGVDITEKEFDQVQKMTDLKLDINKIQKIPERYAYDIFIKHDAKFKNDLRIAIARYKEEVIRD